MKKIEAKSMYQYAHDEILKYIEDNNAEGCQLPSETELAKNMGISRNTVREAIRLLEREGIVYSRHGVGTFVVNIRRHLSTSISVLESSTKIIKNHGYTPGTTNVQIVCIAADERIAEMLEINAGDEVTYIERVRTADKEPVVFVRDYIANNSLSEIKGKNIKFESLFEYLQENFDIKIGYVTCNIKAVISDDELQKKLKLKEQTALLLLEQTHYSTKGTVVFYSDSYFVSDKFNFNVIRRCV